MESLQGLQGGSNKHLLDWDETDVQLWFESLGMSGYEQQIRDHKVQGDTLCMLDLEGLKALGIVSIGRRLILLKSIYRLKLANGIPFGDDDYIPPSSESVTLENIHANIKEQANRLLALEEDNRSLSLAMQTFSEQITKLRFSLGLKNDSVVHAKETPVGEAREPTVNEDGDGDKQNSPSEPYPPKLSAQDSLRTPSTSQDPPQSGNPKVNLNDPTWKVLPAALKKHKINTEDWPNYAMFISYGPPGNRTKRLLELEEKPLYLFKKLKERKKNPAFLLKNMKELRTPFLVEGVTPQSQASTFSHLSSGTVANGNSPHPILPQSRAGSGSLRQ
ncbi:hypothetical protein D9613_006892 [Agrocybe pediades]|uniref:SAM domain-containing protein n=1 Tax=Agrocybe pediades TaxID=84607 RepID=A0A8H4VHQ2_9AGAR|nr:hypothetical protein D9613_006892 [Agrocybe pediades]